MNFTSFQQTVENIPRKTLFLIAYNIIIKHPKIAKKVPLPTKGNGYKLYLCQLDTMEFIQYKMTPYFTAIIRKESNEIYVSI